MTGFDWQRETTRPDWQKEMTYFTILYRMLECKEKIPVISNSDDYDFVAQDIVDLNTKNLIKINAGTGFYELTDQGRKMCQQLIAMYDQVAKFEVFSTVNLAMGLSNDITNDNGELLDQFYDPRFQAPDVNVDSNEDFGTEDMRLAMITFLCEQMATDEEPLDLDSHRVVFIQMLSTGRFKSKDIWFNLKLGKLFRQVDDIVQTAYTWHDVADNDEEAVEVMRNLYTAGMLEQRKRDGFECTGCGTPLAIFEMNARADGETLDTCPNPDCGASFNPPPPDYTCPTCDAGITKSQRTCTGCGALIDWSLPAGTVQTETITEEYEEPAWCDTYGYIPYGYYDPYDPFVDVLTFGVVCAVLW